MAKKHRNIWERLQRDPFVHPIEEYPLVSIVVPTYNSAEALPLTMESVFAQEYPRWEAIIVDANSDDSTTAIVENYHDERVRFFSVSSYHTYEMLNKGISLAQGEYLHFLYPGSYYLTPLALQVAMGFALNQLSPELILSASLVRERGEDSTLLFRPLDRHFLYDGLQPTRIESCWIAREAFRVMGKFRTDLFVRGSLDFFCRFMQYETLRFASYYRVFIDCEPNEVDRSTVYVHFTETVRIIYHYFGLWAAAKWIFTQQDLWRFFRLWLKNMWITLFGNR